MIENRTAGFIYLGIFGLIFAYFTVWVIILPFIDEDVKRRHVEWLFPPVEVALLTPVIVGSLIFFALFARAYYLVNKCRKKNQ